MVRLTAKKQITIEHISAILTIKLKESRPDLIFLMKNFGQLDVSGGELANLQYHLEYLNLFKDGIITTSGDNAIETGMVYIPESGFYDIYYISQPELGLDAEIIHFERKSPNMDNMDGDTKPFSEYEQFDGKKWISWKDKEVEFVVYFERSGDNPPMIILKKEIDCIVKLDSKDYPSMQNTMRMNGNEFKYEDKSYTNFDLNENLPNLISDWDSQMNAKRVSFKNIKDNSDLLRQFKTRGHGLEKKLIFSDGKDDDIWSIDIDHIDIVPKTNRDAEKWVGALLRLHLQEEKCHATLEYCEDVVSNLIDDSPLNRSYPNLSLKGNQIFETMKGFDDNDIIQDIQTAEDLSPDNSFLMNNSKTGGFA